MAQIPGGTDLSTLKVSKKSAPYRLSDQATFGLSRVLDELGELAGQAARLSLDASMRQVQ